MKIYWDMICDQFKIKLQIQNSLNSSWAAEAMKLNPTINSYMLMWRQTYDKEMAKDGNVRECVCMIVWFNICVVNNEMYL